jgi:anti-sigma factor RsiW
VDCRDARPLLPAYADGELDLVRHLQVEHHLADCGDCGDRERGLRSLRAAVAGGAPYHRAPESLRARLAAGPPTEPAPAARKRAAGRFPAVAAGLLLGAALTAGVFAARAGVSAEGRLADEVVAGHVRALQVDHATDVASSDRHTVKPWFRGKLDFAPQVPDLAAHGFPLTGGRLDYLAGRPVAALVYHRRAHAIDVLTWPAESGDVGPVRALHRQGFHVRHWQRAGMTYWAVTDLNPEELDEFVNLFRAAAAPAP